jgi:hypothetical protein
MKKLPGKADIWLVLGITLLALAPMTFIALSQMPKSQGRPGPTPSPLLVTVGNPTALPTPTSVPTVVYPFPPVLSPDGLYAAAKPSLSYITGPGSSTQSPLGELHIFRVSDRSVVSKIPINTLNSAGLQWADNNGLIVDSSDGAFFWSRSELLQQTMLDPSQARGFSNEDTWGDTYVTSDGRIAVKRIDDTVKAFEVATGKPVTPGFQWLRVTRDHEMVLQPVPAGKSDKELVAVLSADWEDPHPTPTPSPTPVPTPKPLTPEQGLFLKEEERRGEEVSNIVARLDGEEEISDAERKRLEAYARRINRAMSKERNRLFPQPSQSVQSTPPVTPKRFAEVEARDLRSGKLKWHRKIRTEFFKPRPQFTPDGTLLLIFGTLRYDEDHREDDNGIEVLDPSTGRTVRSLEASGASWGQNSHVGFFNARKPVLVIADTDEKRRTLLRQIDLLSGRVQGSWSLDALKPLGIRSFNNFSCDAAGQTWSFETKSGWGFFSRARISAQLKAAT